MSEVLRASAGGAAAVSVGEQAVPGHEAPVGQIKHRSSQSGDAGSTPKASSSAEEDKQQKYHEQMLYPTPGTRNYGFSDDFMMFTFKVEACKRQEKHARGSCPYAHPGDVAQRRHPDSYQALLCPEVRAKKVCPRANDCQCSHSAFEFWLHPDRYRTSLCEKGERCSRPVCFFAHNEKELRSLPAGLKPALPPPDDASKRPVIGAVVPRAGVVGGGMHGGGMAQQHPRSSAEFVGVSGMQQHAGMMAPPAYNQQQAVYMQQGYQGMHQQPMVMMSAGFSAHAAGFSTGPTAAGYRHRQQNVPPALDMTAMQAQFQPYGTMMGAPYAVSQSPLLSPAGALQGQGVGAGGMLLAGNSAATAQQLSPVGAHGSAASSSGAGASAGGMWQQQQQVAGAQTPQARANSVATTPSPAGMQLSDPVLQQFSQLGMGSGGITPQTSYDGSAGGTAMLQTQVVTPYGQQAVMYSPGGAEQGWGATQQPLAIQQSSQQSAQYAIPQYATAQAVVQDTQHAVRAGPGMQQAQQLQPAAVMESSMMPAQVGVLSQQQQAAAAAGGLAALAQPWVSANGVVLGPQGFMSAAMGGANQPTSPMPHATYDVAGGW